MSEEQNRFSLRKLTVGLASVLIGVSIFGTSQQVKADTVANNQTSSVTSNAQSSDTQENKNVAESTFSNDNQANNAKSNLIQTQDKAKNDQTDSLNQNPTNSQEANNSNDLQEKSAEKSIVGSSSTLKINNQSNDHAENNSQTQSQKLDITKNSQQLNKKVLATNLTQDNLTQKDYTPDINAWTGHDDGTYYILDKYTPQNDAEKDLIIIPNEADFEKAGKSTNGHEVGITSKTVGDFMHQINPKEVHFSETNAKKIKAVDTDWRGAFSPVLLSNFKLTSHLQAITGNSFDTSNIKIMTEILSRSHELTDISALSTWNVSNVSGHLCFSGALGDDTKLTNLTPLTNWDVSNASDMGNMFDGDISLTDISPLNKWNTKNVLYFDNIFRNCQNLVNADAINNWDFSSVSTDPSFGNLRGFFDGDHKLMIHINKDSNLDDYTRKTNHLNAFYNSGTIVTDNTKLIKLLTNNDLQNETATAKRTITFSGLPANKAISPIVQLIHYTKLVNATIDMSQTGDNNKQGVLNNPYYGNTFQLDASKQNDDVIIDGVVYFKPVKIPHVNGYKAHLVRNKLNPALFMVSFIAVPTENKPSTPVEGVPSKPSAPADNPNNSAWTNLDHKVVDALNQSDSGWTMPENTSTYTVEVPADDAIIDLSDLVIAEPVHAQTTTQIRVTKRFKLSKKHVAKHLKHRKKAVRTFKKYRL